MNGSAKKREEFFKTVSLPRRIPQSPKLAGYRNLRGMHFALIHLLNNLCRPRFPINFAGAPHRPTQLTYTNAYGTLTAGAVATIASI